MRKDYKLADGDVVFCEPEEASIIDFCNPDQVEMRWLIDSCSISDHNILSAMDPDEQGRIEFEEDHLAIILKIPKNYCSADNFMFKVISLGIFMYQNQLIIISGRDESAVEEMSQNHKIHGLNDVLVRLLAGTISHFLGHLKVINMLTDALEEKVKTSMANEHLINMFTIGKSLVYYLNGINSNQVVMEKVKINAKRIGFTPEQVEHLDDVIIDNAQCNKQADIYSTILTGLMDSRGSIVNNNLNLLIKRLTIVSIVFMPLNVLAGVGGMSEFSAMTEGVPKFVSYSLFMVGLCLVAWLTYLIIQRFSGDETKPHERHSLIPWRRRK